MGSATQRLSQHQRLFKIDTVLGDDVFLVETLSGHEEMCGLFEYNVELCSERYGVSPSVLIGTPVKLGIRLLDEKNFRWMNGYFRRFRAIPPGPRNARYAAEIVPQMWFLTKTTDCFIYQNIKVPKVLDKVFKKYGINDVDMGALQMGKYGDWEYLTQYRETAFDFANRLMEIEGIFYYFRQEEGKHTLVLGDSQTVHKDCPGQAKFRVEKALGRAVTRGEDMVTNVEWHQVYKSGKYSHRDYNFTNPDTQMQADVPTIKQDAGNEKWEVYDYPGEYEQRDEADAWGKRRMEAEEHDQETITGEGAGRAMAAGFKFELTGADARQLNRTYVVTRVEHEAQESNIYPDDEPRAAFYKNKFTAIPYDTPYRPERKTPRHVMKGLQTAVVVGPKGEEIYTDKYGRIKVQFHWDREGKNDQDSSCWMRVAMPSAGKNFGAMFLPRIGHEVVVAFLEGDPDRPLVIGSVYNDRNMPGWKLPDYKNWSGVRSRSTKGGGVENFNEIRMDDTKGKELLWLHAEKDYRRTVEHDASTFVDHDEFLIVKNDQTEEIRNDRHVKVKGEERRETEKDLSEKVGGDHKEKVDGTRGTSIGGDLLANVSGKLVLDVSRGMELSTPATFSLSSSQGMIAQDDMNVTIKAGMQLTLQSSGGSISICPAGIFISGTMVYINSGSAPSAPSPPSLGGSPQAPVAPKTPPNLVPETPQSDVGKTPEPPKAPPPAQALPAGSTGEVLEFEKVTPEGGGASKAAASPSAKAAQATAAGAAFVAAAKSNAPKVPAKDRAAYDQAVARLEKNTHALEMAKLAKAAHDETGAPPGWKRLNDNLPEGLKNLPWKDDQTGFRASLFESETPGPGGKPQSVLAFKGAEAQNLLPSSATNAARLANAMAAKYGDKGFETTGHGLGGALAASASSFSGAPASTFNAAGVQPNTMSQLGLSPQQAAAVQNFSVQSAVPELEPKFAIPASASSMTPGGKNALGIPPGPDPAKFMSSAQGAAPAQPPAPAAALGAQNSLPSVDAAGNSVPFAKDVGGSGAHGIDFCIRGLEKQKNEDIRTTAGHLR